VSVHDYQMRPSDAGALSGADVVIWTGAGLTPWLSEPIETLASGAAHLELLATPGWTALPMRKSAAFDDGHDHGHDDHGHDDHGHEDHGHDDHGHDDHGHDDHGHDDHGHDDHGHDDHGHDDHGHDDHDHAEDHAHDDAGHDHDHGDTDPHAWLSPAVATAWLGHIAETLAAADPANAEAYRANAAAAAANLAALEAELAAQLAPVAGRAFVVPHDAYQYFETTFALPASGAIALSDAASPGPARIAELRDRVGAGDIACILTDPQTNPDWSAVLRETGVANTAEVDADGTNVTPGPDAHATILRGIATALADCLAG
jgi:zinc transport system substrate-binding protein